MSPNNRNAENREAALFGVQLLKISFFVTLPRLSAYLNRELQQAYCSIYSVLVIAIRTCQPSSTVRWSNSSREVSVTFLWNSSRHFEVVISTHACRQAYTQ
jgi:hypothetical protein